MMNRALPAAGSVPLANATTDGVRVLDIRQRADYIAGPGSLHIELGDLFRAMQHLADIPTVIMSGHGERASDAASLLTRAGFTQLTVLAGSPQDWADAHGEALVTDS